MQALDIIRELAVTTKTTEKQNIIEKAWHTGCMEFFEGVQAAYDGNITYGVKEKSIKKIEEEGNSYQFTPEDSWEEFKEILQRLAERKITGNAATDVLHQFAFKSDANKWNNWYRPVILGDLRCGTTDTLTNKVLEKIAKTDKRAKQYLTPTWEIALAHPVKNPEKQLTGKKLCDIKIDGCRMTILIDPDQEMVTMRSRPGHIKNHLYGVYDSCVKLMKSLKDNGLSGIVLDGEIDLPNKDFQFVQRLMNLDVADATKEDHEDLSALVMRVFDLVPLSEWNNELIDIPQSKRHEALVALGQEYFDDHLIVQEKWEVDFDTKEGQQIWTDLNLLVKNQNLEGIMVKDPDAGYKKKKSNNWLKWKGTVEVTLELIDFEEGELGKKREGLLGAFVCEGEDFDPADNKTKKIKVNVASGFTDEQITDFWNRREELRGLNVEVMADCFIKSRDRVDVWSLRFPRFKGFRGNEPGAKE